MPVIILISVTLLILILWTAIDPWTWEREWISAVPAESYGECQSNNFWAFFGPLMFLLVLAEGLTVFSAWNTKEIAEQFSDTELAFFAIMVQLQAWIVGVPILSVLGNSSADAVYLGRALLIWIFSLSGPVLVISRKGVVAIRNRYHQPEASSIGGSVNITGMNGGGGTANRRQSSIPNKFSRGITSTNVSQDEGIHDVSLPFTNTASHASSENNEADEKPAAVDLRSVRRSRFYVKITGMVSFDR